MGTMFADVELGLQKDAMHRLPPSALGEVQVVLETEFGELAGVKANVRRKPPTLSYEISLVQCGDEGCRRISS